MLSMETFEKIDKLLRLIRDKDLPFGGIQLIFFGDFFQLPPVDSNNFCFESEVWIEANIKTIILQEVFRQQDKVFVDLLDHIRYGNVSKNDIQLLPRMYPQEQGTGA